MKSYKIEIKPSQDQIDKIHKNIGICKYVYNFYLRSNIELYKENKDTDNKKFYSGYDFSKYLNQFIKDNPSYNWIKEGSSKAIKNSIMNAEKAFKRFWKGTSSFPKFKKRNDRVGIYIPNNNKTDFKIYRHKVKIPIFKEIILKEKGYFPLEAKIKSCTITTEAGRYFISFLVDEKEINLNYKSNKDGIGIDLGIKEFAILNDGTSFKNRNKEDDIKKLEKKLKRESRKLSRKLENKKKNKLKSKKNIEKNILNIQRINYKLRNKREGYLKYVVNSLVSVHNLPAFISIEDLKPKEMMKNLFLSKQIQKQSFYKFRQLLERRCKKYGVELRVVDQWYPSSKLCSNCGQIKSDLKLSDRTYECDCGFKEDRDINAAINLMNSVSFVIV